MRRAPRGEDRGTGLAAAARHRGRTQSRGGQDRARESAGHPGRASPRAAGGHRAAATPDRQLMAALFTSLAMLAFAGNSLLCRMALKATAIDPASFTPLPIVSRAPTLWLT